MLLPDRWQLTDNNFSWNDNDDQMQYYITFHNWYMKLIGARPNYYGMKCMMLDVWWLWCIDNVMKCTRGRGQLVFWGASKFSNLLAPRATASTSLMSRPGLSTELFSLCVSTIRIHFYNFCFDPTRVGLGPTINNTPLYSSAAILNILNT